MFVLTITALHLVGMDVVSARREAPQRMYGSGRDAEMACLHWRQQGGQFTSLLLSSKLEEQPLQLRTSIRSCVADLDHPVILGRRYNVVRDAHYDVALKELNHTIVRRFPFPSPAVETDQKGSTPPSWQ